MLNSPFDDGTAPPNSFVTDITNNEASRDILADTDTDTSRAALSDTPNEKLPVLQSDTNWELPVENNISKPSQFKKPLLVNSTSGPALSDMATSTMPAVQSDTNWDTSAGIDNVKTTLSDVVTNRVPVVQSQSVANIPRNSWGGIADRITMIIPAFLPRHQNV